MTGPVWRNVYNLSEDQIMRLDQAEDHLDMMEINEAERILLAMLDEVSDCIPALNILGHLHGRHLSDFERAVECYDKVLSLEPDNAWARDERRRYRRYQTYD
jgi:tetratricopeptide (TPR) repeat protein